jgi:hypothetical protein
LREHLLFQVVVQMSKTLPLRVTILGSDAKEHQYLVKFGEDLRQDQRLEQLFVLMNKILDQDPTCRHRSLSIATYQVLRNIHVLLKVASLSVLFLCLVNVMCTDIWN